MAAVRFLRRRFFFSFTLRLALVIFYDRIGSIIASPFYCVVPRWVFAAKDASRIHRGETKKFYACGPYNAQIHV